MPANANRRVSSAPEPRLESAKSRHQLDAPASLLQANRARRPLISKCWTRIAQFDRVASAAHALNPTN
jgi:hypothetical protein